MELLPLEPRMRWLLSRMAALHEAGAEPVAGLVLPTSRYFPDAFDASPRALEKLLHRVLKHAGLSDVHAELAIAGAAENCSSGACGSPAQGPIRRIEPIDDGYRVTVHASEVKNPTSLTAALVRASAYVWLKEAAYDPRGELEENVDLTGVLLGFGVLLCNGAYIYQKGCGGVRIGSATRLPVNELTLSLAIFCKLHAIRAVSELDPSAKAFFAEARRWADTNERAIGLVASDRTAVDAQSYDLRPARGWFSRLVGLGRSGVSAPDDAELDAVAAEISSARSKRDADVDTAKARRMEELRDLVDEALER
ncbi:MAG TPA: hypothetical protein VFB62_21125 [Polyangiaceae bacterium]|nr:hypothetical protein [Polyangiaceae bacterium]